MPYQPPVLVTQANFGKDEYKDLCQFIEDKVEHLDRRLSSFRTDKLPEYVRLYKGKPKNKEVEWPWKGAANLVFQLIGTCADDLLARIMGGIYGYDPLWSIVLAGDMPDKDGDDLKQIAEKFLMDEAYDPESLDLYRVEQASFHSAIKYGTGGIYLPYEYQKEVEYEYVGGGESSVSAPQGRENEVIRRDGPHPELLPLNRFGFEPNIAKLSNMSFYYLIEPMDYWQIKALPGKMPYYKEDDIKALLASPDATQEDEVEREVNEQFTIGDSGVDTAAARWYIYNVFLKYSKGAKTYSMYGKYHKKSKKVLWVAFNNYPKNIQPVEDVKLAYDDESYLGTGYAEMLHAYQKDVSNNVNWRTNNRNYNMLGVWRVSPESKLSSILDFYPGVAVPAKKDEIEQLKAGVDTGYSNEPDMFIISASKERAGIDPAMGGTGGGIVNPKRGIYSAAGTGMIMTSQNSRNNLRTSDMRSAHVRVGLKLLELYSHFGIGSKVKKYGVRAEMLMKALDAYKKGQLGLQLRSTSAMLNRELERQNAILLTDRLERFYQAQAQIIEALMNPQIPPPLKEYYSQALLANRLLMQDLLRSFSKDNTDALLPDVKALIAQLAQAQQQQQQQLGAGNGDQQAGRPNGASPVPRGAVQGGGVPSAAQGAM